MPTDNVYTDNSIYRELWGDGDPRNFGDQEDVGGQVGEPLVQRLCPPGGQVHGQVLAKHRH